MGKRKDNDNGNPTDTTNTTDTTDTTDNAPTLAVAASQTVTSAKQSRAVLVMEAIRQKRAKQAEAAANANVKTPGKRGRPASTAPICALFVNVTRNVESVTADGEVCFVPRSGWYRVGRGRPPVVADDCMLLIEMPREIALSERVRPGSGPWTKDDVLGFGTLIEA